ncbi:MAG: type II CAAX prenyl endopeptidase Rce1 family protein [Flavobacteriales bacterium]
MMVLFGLLIGNALSLFYIVAVTGTSLDGVAAIISAPVAENSNVLKWANSITQVFSFLLPAVAFYFLFGKKTVNGLMLRTPGFFALSGIAYIFLSAAWIDVVSRLNEWLLPEGSRFAQWAAPKEQAAEQLTEVMLTSSNGWDTGITIVSIALLPAVCEELLFRGVLQPLLAKAFRNIHLAIWVSAALFSAIHMQFYGFLPRMLMGALLGYLVVWSGSLWTSMLAHAANNTLAIVTFMTYHSLNGEELSADSGGVLFNYILSFALFGLATYYLSNRSKWPAYAHAYLGLDAEVSAATEPQPDESEQDASV